jgi:U3 small nucleolar RNA-associated protein 19
MATLAKKEMQKDRISQITADLSSSADLNPLIDLIQELRHEILLRPGDEIRKSTGKGLKFLVRSVQSLLRDGRISLQQVDERGFLSAAKSTSTDDQAEAAKAVREWLHDRWNDTVQLLCDLLSSDFEEIALDALDSLMELQQDASSTLSKETLAMIQSSKRQSVQWSRTPWFACINTLLDVQGGKSMQVDQETQVSGIVLTRFTEKYLQEYDDVRLAFCRHLHIVLQRKDIRVTSSARQHALQLLLPLTAIPTEQRHLDTFFVKEFATTRRSVVSEKKLVETVEKGDDDGSELEDWFSDSDQESNSANGKSLAASRGLGRKASEILEKTASQKRLKRNPAICDAVHSLSAQRVAFSRAWLSVLLPSRTQEGQTIGGVLSANMVHEALVRMHTQILPHLSNPNLMHDFLVDALDAGGATALLALNTLFTLMTKHNLNYPSFYTRLYALLLADPPVLHVRYRSRFLRMLDIFLSSTHLPATLIASFAKRLSRMALRAPAAAIVVVIPFVWNLCKRHKHCLGLLHREFGNDRLDMGPAGLPDPYDATESDPLKTNAIQSSLWELAAMGAQVGAVQQTGASIDAEGQVHYLASVSSLSRILAEPFTKERYGLEDFLDLTYGTMFESESNKTLKKREGKKVIEPAVAFNLPLTQSKKRADTFTVKVPWQEASSKRARLVADEDEEDEELIEDHAGTSEHAQRGSGTLLTNELFVF